MDPEGDAFLKKYTNTHVISGHLSFIQWMYIITIVFDSLATIYIINKILLISLKEIASFLQGARVTDLLTDLSWESRECILIPPL
jgi:hypothetical protein